MEWLRLLFSTEGFTTPRSPLGWSPLLIQATVIGSVLIAIVYLTLAALLILFRARKEAPRLFRSSAVAQWFAAFVACNGLVSLVRALLFYYPCYRLYALLIGLTALLSWITLAVIWPLMLHRQIAAAREERHEFANKVNANELTMSRNLIRLQRIADVLQSRQDALLAIIAQMDRLPSLTSEIGSPDADDPAADAR